MDAATCAGPEAVTLWPQIVRRRQYGDQSSCCSGLDVHKDWLDARVRPDRI
jgi:hypothetical protein